MNILQIPIPHPVLLDAKGWLKEILDGLAKAISAALSGSFSGIVNSIWDIMMDWIYKQVESILRLMINNLSTTTLELFNLSQVQNILEFIRLFGWSLFIVGVLLAVFDICIEYQQTKQLNFKRQIAPFFIGWFAVNLFTTLPIALFRFALDVQSALGYLGWARKSQSLIDAINNSTFGANGILQVLMFITVIYVIIKVFLANIKRGGILLTQIAIGSLHMISIPRGYTDGFWGWCKQIVALCVTTVMQNTLLYLGLVILCDSNVLIGIGVMIAAKDVPRIASQFGLDTSAKGNVTAVVHGAQSAVTTARTLTGIIKTAK